MIKKAIFAAVLIATAGLAVPASATVPPPTVHEIGGLYFGMDCMSASRCELVGTLSTRKKAFGDIESTNNGAYVPVNKIKSSIGMYGVSCPSAAGCVAIGRAPNNNAILVSINATGKVTKTAKLKVHKGVLVNSISCSSLTSCGGR